MISLKSEFRFINRGHCGTLVLIPGWALDYRIFDLLDLNYNYLLVTKLYPFNFKYPLQDELDKQNLDKVSIFGFSLGGFLAAEFACEFPGKIDELILVSIRKSYNTGELNSIKEQVRKNKRAYLYKFYVNCFSRADQEGIDLFRGNFLKKYANEINMDELIWGLDYLSTHAIRAGSLAKVNKIKIFHAAEDKLAPLEESLQIKSELPQAKFVYLKDLGHLPFLNSGFKHKFYYG